MPKEHSKSLSQEPSDTGDSLLPPEKPISIWERIAIYFAFLIPLIAALAKAFTNSFSTLAIFVFFCTGLFVVNPALFAGPVLIAVCAIGIATILVSLNMEGRNLYKHLCEEIDKIMKSKDEAQKEELKLKQVQEKRSELKQALDEELKQAEQEIRKKDPLSFYITSYFTGPFSWIEEKFFPRAEGEAKRQKWQRNTGYALTLLMFILSSATKGFAMAPGIYTILGLASCGPWGWVILGFAVLGVMGVSAAKEGKKLIKQAELWTDPKKNKNEPLASAWKIGLVYSFASFLPLAAALAKALGYSYGVLMLLAFIYTGSFTATAVVSAWLPLIIVVGIGLFFVSLRMEGYSLFKFMRRWFISDEALLLQTKYYLVESERKKQKINDDKLFLSRKKAVQEAFSQEKRLWVRVLEKIATVFFNYILAYGLPFLAFVGKSSVMMVGSISAIVLLTGAPITWWLLLIGACFGLAVGLVSVGKEGEKTCKSFDKYYTLCMYKLLGHPEDKLGLPLFETLPPLPTESSTLKPTSSSISCNAKNANSEGASSAVVLVRGSL